MIVKHESVDPTDFGGLQILDYTARLDGRSSFAVITVPAGVAHAEAWSRRSDKYYYVMTGGVEFTLDGRLHVLHAGDLCIVPKGRHFSYRNREPNEARICLVHTPSFDLESEVFMEDAGA